MARGLTPLNTQRTRVDAANLKAAMAEEKAPSLLALPRLSKTACGRSIDAWSAAMLSSTTLLFSDRKSTLSALQLPSPPLKSPAGNPSDPLLR